MALHALLILVGIKGGAWVAYRYGTSRRDPKKMKEQMTGDVAYVHTILTGLPTLARIVRSSQSAANDEALAAQLERVVPAYVKIPEVVRGYLESVHFFRAHARIEEALLELVRRCAGSSDVAHRERAERLMREWRSEYPEG